MKNNVDQHGVWHCPQCDHTANVGVNNLPNLLTAVGHLAVHVKGA
jgi:hypothetical protein